MLTNQSTANSIVLLPIQFNPNVIFVGWLFRNPVEIVLVSTAFTDSCPFLLIFREKCKSLHLDRSFADYAGREQISEAV